MIFNSSSSLLFFQVIPPLTVYNQEQVVYKPIKKNALSKHKTQNINWNKMTSMQVCNCRNIKFKNNKESIQLNEVKKVEI